MTPGEIIARALPGALRGANEGPGSPYIDVPDNPDASVAVDGYFVMSKVAAELIAALDEAGFAVVPKETHDPAAHADEMEALSPGYKARREVLKRE